MLEEHEPWSSGVDPGFTIGGGTNPGGAPTYDFAKISEKVHEIENILGRRRGRPPGRPPWDLRLVLSLGHKIHDVHGVPLSDWLPHHVRKTRHLLGNLTSQNLIGISAFFDSDIHVTSRQVATKP